MMEVVVTWSYVVQSSSQIITTNKPTPSFFTGRMPFLSPTNSVTFHGLAYPKLIWGSSNFVFDH